MTSIDPDLVSEVSSFDGTRITYQIFGQNRARTVVIANGLGVGYKGIALQVAHLQKKFRLVCWDHRGIFRSAVPGEGGVTIEAQARDCLRVMEAAGLGRSSPVDFIGWSMGVQVGFETLRLQPGWFKKMVCIGGVAGRPFRTAFPFPGADRVLPRIMGGAAKVAPLVSGLTRTVVGSDRFFLLARLAGYIRPDTNREVFMTMARGVASHNHRIYLDTLAEIGRHDATEVLRRLEIPVLFLAGGKDYMTPRRELERLAAMARDGRVYIVETGSHFTLLEAPDEVNRALEGFLVE